MAGRWSRVQPTAWSWAISLERDGPEETRYAQMAVQINLVDCGNYQSE